MSSSRSKRSIFTACVLDTETGGLKANECAITQLSCQMVRCDNFEVIGVFDEYIKPYPKGDFATGIGKTLRKKKEIEKEENSYFSYDEKALAVTGLSFDFLMRNGKDINDVADSFIKFISEHTMGGKPYKPFLVGHNIAFDWNFLQHMFTYTNKMSKLADLFAGNEDLFGNFYPNLVDTITLAKMAYAHDPSVNSYRLGAMTDLMGIKLVDAHSSMADVEATNGLFTVFTNRMRSGIQDDEASLIKQAEKTRVHFKI